MATSGIVKTNVSYGSYFWVKWEIRGSQDIANNRTTIAWSCGLHPEEQYYTNAVRMDAVTINGTEVYSGGTYSNITDYKDRTFDSGTLTIPHNSDGSKSFTISAVSGWIYSNGNYYGASQTFTLPTIPRASSVSCSSANIGSNATITINRASTSFTHTLTYSFGSLSGTIATKTSSTNISWTIPTTFYGQIPNSKSGTGTITCDTYNGSTLIGSKSTSFTATVSESASKPTLSPTVSDSNTTTTALTGNSSKFIKYYSNAAVATGAKARNSATLKSQKITCEAKSLTSASGTINAVESGSFTFSATDSRGYTTTQTVNNTLIDYIKLTCSLNAGAPTTAGVATLKISGNYWDGTFGKVANTLTVQYRYKTQGGSYGSWTTVSATKSNNTYNATATIRGLNYQTTYVFQARAIDKLATISTDEQARRTTPIFDWSKDDFNVNGTLKVNSTNIFDLIYPVGSIYMNVNSTNPGTLFGGTWEQIQGKFLLGMSSSYPAGSQGGEARHTLTTAEMPSHGHNPANEAGYYGFITK
nr:tail protein [uncultured phage]